MERNAAHTVAVATLALILTSCGTVGSGEASTADLTIEPEPASGVVSTQPNVATTTAGSTTTMEMDPLEQMTLDAFREWTGALAAGDYERAWRLMAPSSQAALGSYEFFASLGSEMTEGWGSWAATPDLTISIREDLAGRLVAVIGGTVEREGMTEDTTTRVFVVASGDAAAVSPFEEFGNVAAGLANPDTTVPLPEATGSGRRIVYANAAQRVWIVEENDTVADTYLVSGREGVPAPGIYEVFSMSETAFAGHDDITMWFMVRFTRASSGIAIGFHSIPNNANGEPMQTEEQLGEFHSAGCVRQSIGHAAALFEWASIGTPVHVLP
ncbi:MAG: L,D-transpeptidase [bacterium]|nr:L,D-transpeptidase [bacterium]